MKTDHGLSGLEYPLYFSNTLFFIQILFLLIYFPSLLTIGKSKIKQNGFFFNIRNKWKKGNRFVFLARSRGQSYPSECPFHVNQPPVIDVSRRENWTPSAHTDYNLFKRS